MKRILAGMLSLLLCSPAFGEKAAPESLRDSVRKLKVGSSVSVKLLDKTKITGKLVAVQEDGITVSNPKNPQSAVREISYDRIKSIEKKAPAWQTGLGIGILGFVAVPIVVLCVLLAANGGWKS